MSHHVLCDFSNYLKNLANVQFERIIIAVYEVSCRPWWKKPPKIKCFKKKLAYF